MAPDTLSDAALGRATLARQLLLERAPLGVEAAVHHLVGLQAQEPQNPYVALWSRLEAFDPLELSELLERRRVVRTVVMRATIHLVTAADCLLLRPLMQPVLDGELARQPQFSRPLAGVDLEPVLAFAQPFLEAEPRTMAQLRAALAERFPGLDAAALAYACRNRLALVQVPPRGLWRRSGTVRSTTAQAWLGAPLATTPSIDDVVLRYLAAFGPATVADVTTWCRLTGMREVVERLRPRLVTFRDERSRELFDLPDAPRPAAETPAPVRFLPLYDNVLLSHADRSRFIADADRRRLGVDRVVGGSVLVGGRARSTWAVNRDPAGGPPELVVSHLDRLSADERAELRAEGARFVRFHEQAAGRPRVRLVRMG